jgi:hypothetical protein
MRRLIGLSLSLALVLSAVAAAPASAAKGLNEKQFFPADLEYCGQSIPGDFIAHVLMTATVDGSGGLHQKDKWDFEFRSDDGEVRAHEVFNWSTNTAVEGASTTTKTETMRVFGLARKPITSKLTTHHTFNANGDLTSLVIKGFEADCPV